MPRGIPFKKGYDERRNLIGAPKRGESHAETLDFALNLTPEKVVELIGRDNDLGKAYANMPKDVPMKVLLHLRVLAAEMFEPSSGRYGQIMERTEGKVETPIKHSGNLVLTWKDFIEDDNEETGDTKPADIRSQIPENTG